MCIERDAKVTHQVSSNNFSYDSYCLFVVVRRPPVKRSTALKREPFYYRLLIIPLSLHQVQHYPCFSIPHCLVCLTFFPCRCNFSGLGDWKAAGLYRHWRRGGTLRRQQGKRRRKRRGGVRWGPKSTQPAARPEDEHVRPAVTAVLPALLRRRHEPGQGALAPGGATDAPNSAVPSDWRRRRGGGGGERRAGFIRPCLGERTHAKRSYQT